MTPIHLTIQHFIAEPITVEFKTPPDYAKSPPCPDGMVWCGRHYTIRKSLREWKDFTRRGRMARNMQPQHAAVASQRGSWGVGRFYFEVETEEGSFFRIYYDRAPKDALDRYGHWILLAELVQTEE